MNIFVDERKSACDYPISIAKTLAAIETATEDIPIIVDFDETLLLRNSTAEYLKNLQPYLLGALILKLLNYLKPWNWLPFPFRGTISQDWLQVIITTLLLPWNLWLWQNKAKQLADNYRNIQLVAALNKKSSNSIIIATLGFKFIVRPIMQDILLKGDFREARLISDRLIACRFWQGASDRQLGKLPMVLKVLDAAAVSRAIVITDSETDRDLLLQVATPCLVVWTKTQAT
ncbi:MAG TPA: hypothetical protein ACFCUY_15360 [Xenococcaceae cyanobacterium]